MRQEAWLALALVGVAFAGCVEEPIVGESIGTGDADASRLNATASPPPLDLAATGCVEGGGHSVHPKFLNPLPAPWIPADVLDDVGPQLTYSEIPDPMKPVPEKGSTMGNYHASVWCESWTFRGRALGPDHILGFVGMKVEKPEWSDDAPTHHYVVTVVATSDEELHAALTKGGIHAMKATGSLERLPGDTLRVRMQTDRNGEYDSIFKPKHFGNMEASHVRLWFQSPPGDASHGHGHGDEPTGPFTPIALDLLNEGGNHYGSEQQGYFSHAGTDHHFPLPGAYGHTAALWYEGFDRVVEWGPRPDVTVADAYVH